MLQLNHVGLATRDAEELAQLIKLLTGCGATPAERIPGEGVQVRFVDTGQCRLELLEPLVSDSPLARFLDRRGDGLHHIAFTVADIEHQLEQLQMAGFMPLSNEPRIGAGGKRIFFLHPKTTGRVLIELCQPAVQWPVSLIGSEWPLKEALLTTGRVRMLNAAAEHLIAARPKKLDSSLLAGYRSLVLYKPKGQLNRPASEFRHVLICLPDNALDDAVRLQAHWTEARFALLPADTPPATWATLIMQFWATHD